MPLSTFPTEAVEKPQIQHQAKMLRDKPNLTEGVDFIANGGVAYLTERNTSEKVGNTLSV